MQYKYALKPTGFRDVGLTILLITCIGLQAHADPVTLGQAAGFGVLASSSVTNTGDSVIYGNVGVSSGSAITGFLPGIIDDGTKHADDALATQAHLDATTAYNTIGGETFTQNLTGQDLGGLTLTPGVYYFASSAQLTGNLTLNDLGDPNARFDFQIGSTLTTASSSTVTFTGSNTDSNVFWQVGSSATLGTNTDFAGNILALASITMNTGATDINGRALALNGAVTLDTNHVGSISPVPEPSATVSLACLGLPLGLAWLRGLSRRR